MNALTKSWLLIVSGLMFCNGQFSLASLDQQCTEEQKEKGRQFVAHMAERSPPRLIISRFVKESSDFVKTEGILSIDDSADENTKINFNYLYYRTKKNEQDKAPVVFIYSGLTGISYWERSVAHFFADKGISVVITHYIDEKHIYNIHTYGKTMKNTMRVSLATVDHFLNKPEIDPEKTALLGASYGGIRGVLHMAADKRIKAASLIVAGSPFAEILANSELDQVMEIKKKQKESAGIESDEEYLAILKKQTPIDLKDLACQRKTSDFYLFISDKDSWVPTLYQWKLYVTLGFPKYHHFKLGHMGTPLWVSLSKLRSIRKFYKKTWNLSQPTSNTTTLNPLI